MEEPMLDSFQNDKKNKKINIRVNYGFVLLILLLMFLSFLFGMYVQNKHPDVKKKVVNAVLSIAKSTTTIKPYKAPKSTTPVMKTSTIIEIIRNPIG